MARETDGTTYVIHPTNGISEIIVAELTDDLTTTTGRFHRNLKSDGGYDGHEAPAVFRHADRWFMLTSRESGSGPSPCRVCVADRLAEPWEVMRELCDIIATNDTFASQPACVWPVDPKLGRFMYAYDHWNSQDLGDSRYIWLPLVWQADRPQLRWLDTWSPADVDPWSQV